MASSYAYTSLPIRASLASSGPAGRNQPLPVSIKAITRFIGLLVNLTLSNNLAAMIKFSLHGPKRLISSTPN